MLPPLDPGSLSRRLARPLTPAEVRIAMLVGEGLTQPQLAVALGKSYDTISTHLQSIAGKIGESGDAPESLRGIERIRFWIMRLQATTLSERLIATQRELDNANGLSVAREAVRRSEGQRGA